MECASSQKAYSFNSEPRAQPIGTGSSWNIPRKNRLPRMGNVVLLLFYSFHGHVSGEPLCLDKSWWDVFFLICCFC